MIARVKNAYRGRRTVRCVFEAPRVLETVQYMSRMKALGLLIPKVTLGSEIGSRDQKLGPLEDWSKFKYKLYLRRICVIPKVYLCIWDVIG